MTTRIVSVSKACCSSVDDSFYQMEPLSHESGCPGEFEEISRDILKKCGGVPLAIITLASLLASDRYVKSMDNWKVLLNSIGRGLTEDNSLEEMQRILSFSYYDLPSHLKTCLLYLSIYPEDRDIEKEKLIWKWVAESFMQCKKEESLYELGETYFNELINRSMIQPIYNNFGKVTGCRVHDMVLDLICSLSSEANFVTILDGSDVSTSRSNVRRLSLQDRNRDYQATSLTNSMSVSQVRSITVYTNTITIPALSRFDVLRVLDLSGCYLGETICYLREVGNLFHLRFLDLHSTGISEVRAEIGNLQFLQVLDVGGNPDLKYMPSTVYKLKELMFLHVDKECKMLPYGLGNLTSIEVLKTIGGRSDIMQELGKLAGLRVLEICFGDETLETEEAFVESVCNLHSLQSISLSGKFGSMDLLGECWAPSQHLSIFDSYFTGVFSVLPAWIKGDPWRLSNLSDLRIVVKEVRQEDVRILGRLPALRRLQMRSTHQTQQRLLLVDGFRCMVEFRLYTMLAVQIVFEAGALPRAETVGFNLGAQLAIADGNRDFDLGMENLLSLREAIVWIYHGGVTVGEAKKTEAAIRRAPRDHPNHPTVRIDMWPSIPQGSTVVI